MSAFFKAALIENEEVLENLMRALIDFGRKSFIYITGYFE